MILVISTLKVHDVMISLLFIGGGGAGWHRPSIRKLGALCTLPPNSDSIVDCNKA